MDVQALLRLVQLGETATVDFKIDCKAFAGDFAAKAELGKDLCAMANNGARKSYLIVGVSDDGKNAKSVVQPKLADDNLQSFAKQAVSPPPRVRLVDMKVPWRGGTVDLKVVVVGPNPRHAFRLAQDFISYREGVCFRRNEVWIRRQATTDLATPEEVARLDSGADHIEATSPRGPVYARLPAPERRSSILEDLNSASDDLNVFESEQLCTLAVETECFPLRLMYLEEIPPKSWLIHELLKAWAFECGVLVVTPEKLRRGRFFEQHPVEFGPPFTVRSTERWGTYAIAPIPGSGQSPTHRLGFASAHFQKSLTNGAALSVAVFVLSGVQDSRTLRRHVREMCAFANGPDVAQTLLSLRRDLVGTLRDAARRRTALVQRSPGDPKETHTFPVRYAPTGRLRKRVITNITRITDPQYLSAIRYMLRVTQLPPATTELPAGRQLGEALLAKTRTEEPLDQTMTSLEIANDRVIQVIGQAPERTRGKR